MDKLEVAKQAAMGLVAGMDMRLVLGGLRSMYPEDSYAELIQTLLTGVSAYLIDSNADNLYNTVKTIMLNDDGGVESSFRHIINEIHKTGAVCGMDKDELDEVLASFAMPKAILGQAMIIAGERMMSEDE